MPMLSIVVGSASAASRFAGSQPQAFAREPLLGDRDLWQLWFAAAGVTTQVTPVAIFNDVGHMLQAAEQNLGLAMCRELLAADALHNGTLVRLSPLSIPYEQAYPYKLAYPATLRDWPPLAALRAWLHAEIERSRKTLYPVASKRKAKTAAR
jgi:LysR family transcriptional regulator, glycine cleavage system transcriptional activator